ncbi:hypothetical protein [Bradyrhizobium cajani]|uniref:BA14K family protein n=1 Tax=Bradyrhizobium cajani TaxID=1928661 RepID=A0A844T842_9BRAD|nr:hypothetical protein [Bradyrhizobium cajani]MCP3369358.1 hypothetical protein [Bradyrhizobium cajani]MVT75127.1 hypothetical protein [Bradyrhizobium cajani]
MNIRAVCHALILGGLVTVAVPSPLSLAQPKDNSAAATKQTGATAPSKATPNTTMRPFKHRYWRHRGGRHPHYGSRRLGT